jgi:recombination protein RecR
VVDDQPINIHLTGCHHSCAQHYVGDLGLIGVRVEDGESEIDMIVSVRHPRPSEADRTIRIVSPCGICRDPQRDQGMICVVEGVAELWALERAHAHRGLYHVLGGTLSALGGVGPEDLAVQPLLARIEAAEGAVREVILALPATVDGATTAHYLTDRLRPAAVQVTRLAQGVPIGGALDVLDEGTLAAALKARRAV